MRLSGSAQHRRRKTFFLKKKKEKKITLRNVWEMRYVKRMVGRMKAMEVKGRLKSFLGHGGKV
jgi:hypothetical protein